MFNIIVFIGPSGAGKSTLQGLLGYNPVITWTSRPPRIGEVHGKHYNFANKEEILSMYREGLLLEYTEYNSNIYGIDLDSIKKLIDKRACGSVVVDANGVRKLKNRFTDAVLIIGVIAPYEECKERLVDRGDKNIDERLSGYSNEVKSVMELSDIIINNPKDNWEKSSNLIGMLKLAMEKYKKDK